MARAVVTLSLLIFGLVDHLLHIDTSPAAMSATTCSKITKGKAPTPYDKPPTKQHRPGQSLSPRLVVNHLIGEINLPRERFDTNLEPLHVDGGGIPDAHQRR
jgi:hypothetical protein